MRRSAHLLSDVLGAAELQATYADLDTLGFDTIWTSETIGRDIITSMTALALSTSRSRVGAGIVPIMHRHPFEIAMAATSIDAFSGGRFNLGLGVSHPPFVRSYGLEIEHPLKYVREFMQVLRPLLAGEEVDFHGEMIEAHGAPLPLRDYAGGADIPIYLAALKPGMCRLVGEYADGMYLWMSTPEYVEKARGWVADGAVAAGRSAEDIDILLMLPTYVTDDVAGARDACRFVLKKFLRMPFYQALIEDEGLGSMQDCLDISDPIIDNLCLVGDPDSINTRIEEYEAAGVTHMVHYPVFSRPEQYMPEYRRIAASHVTAAR